MKHQWKDIAPIPNATEFVDISLSRTQRQLPTQIRHGFKISRIRAFYTRKVKYTAETFSEKLDAILQGFPRLSDVHPFYRDLFNTLYDADHLKIALASLNRARTLIQTVSRDYVRLIKYAGSLYQCKQLKVSALGRMVKIIGKLKDALIYLEEVRMHLGRLPAIDPTTRTLLITGYPNVGKSSFLKNISRADVDVQPYAFTTKSLYVGHFDYKLLRFQAVDTPGILDHPLEEMNTIEMQSVTSLAHLRAAILYFLDPSEHCGFSFAQQIKLFHQIKPLFTGKLVFLVCNKADVLPFDGLDQEYKDQVQAIVNGGNVELLHCSCATQEGVQSVKQAVCDRLLAMRNAEKLKAGTNSSGEVTGRLGELLRRIHVATPANGATRPSHIPEGALNKMKYDRVDPNRPRLEVDIEAEEGGPGVYNINLKKKHLLENDEWKEDKIPEVVLGRNVYDYIDPDIEANLAALEEEEEQLAAQGYYDSDIDIDDEETATTARRAELIREKRMLIRNESKLRKSLKNRAVMPRSKMPAKKLSSMESHFNTLGLDATPVAVRARSASRGRQSSRGRSEGADGDAMEIDTPKARLSRSISQARSKSTTRRFDGVQHDEDREKAEKKRKLQQIRMNRMARQGEADRHQIAALSKHLVAGKRGIGTTRSR